MNTSSKPGRFRTAEEDAAVRTKTLKILGLLIVAIIAGACMYYALTK